MDQRQVTPDGPPVLIDAPRRFGRRCDWAALLGVLFSILSLGWAGCAGYQVGNWSMYPSHIQTVHVPMFQSNSFRRNLGERLTEAVIKEIEARTPYKVVSTPDADSTLSGQIITDTKRVQVENPFDEPRQLEYSLFVQVRWLDRRGEVLRQGPPVALPPEIIGVTGHAGLVPEFGQSGATSSQQAIQRAAEQIVGMMEMPW